jgi:hypothetical protein
MIGTRKETNDRNNQFFRRSKAFTLVARGVQKETTQITNLEKRGHGCRGNMERMVRMP